MNGLSLGWTLALFLAASGAGTQEVSPEAAARFEKVLEKLGSDSFQDREEATKEIADLPSEAWALVEKAIKRPDLELEIRRRLELGAPRLKAKVKRELAARKRESCLAWTRKSVLEAYDKSTPKGAAWDRQARETLEAVIPAWVDLTCPVSQRDVRAYALSKSAILEGCIDPLVLYVHARAYDAVVRKEYLEAFRLHLNAACAMKERGAAYPALRQAYVFARAAEFQARFRNQPTEEDRKESRQWLDLGLERYAEALKDGNAPDSVLLNCAQGLVDAGNARTTDRKVGLDLVLGVLTKARPQSTLPLLLKGSVYIQSAWDARNARSAEGWKLWSERLAEAETVLTQAWEKSPDDAAAPTLMLAVMLGQDKGREAMEAWYKRAVGADPDNFEAVTNKMTYLEPHWHGSREDMLTFGHQLLSEGNWEARLPFALVDAHRALALHEKGRYYRKEDVWKDFNTVYQEWLKRHPDADYDRSWFAMLACQCGKYDEANRQFETLGDKVVVSVFGGRVEMKAMRAQAAENDR